jgi:hypothetical protein
MIQSVSRATNRIPNITHQSINQYTYIHRWLDRHMDYICLCLMFKYNVAFTLTLNF